MSVDYDRLHKDRVAKARQVMKKLDLDAFVATTLENVWYVASRRPFFVLGWMPNAMAVLPKDGDAVFLHADDFVAPTSHWDNEGRSLANQYQDINHYTVWNPVIAKDIWTGWLKKSLDSLGIKRGRLGLDMAPWQWYASFKKTLPDLEIVSAEEEIIYARAVKTPDEITLLKKANDVASRGVEAGLEAIKPGVREYEVFGAFMGELYRHGSEGDGFWPFLTSGPCVEGALYPTNRMIQEGDAVVLDMGPILDGYNGDCMRTAFVGTPTNDFKEMYKVNYESMYAVVNKAGPGVKASECYEAGAQVYREAGYPEPRFDFGHGIGLSCCEMPTLVKKDAYNWVGGPARRDIELKPGMCFSSEPRIYKYTDPKTFIQAALEEVIIITDTGREVITSTPFLDELL
ncbi:MAG: M24 family metallopeptidase [Candidatus Heimdallarchaeota archaeon]